MGFNRFLPLLAPILALFFLELYFFWPKMVFVFCLFFYLFIFFSLRQFIKKSSQKESLLNFFLFPALSFILIIVFTSLLTSKILVHLIFILEFVLIYIYFKSIYYKLLNNKKYIKGHLENFSSYANFILFYFLSSVIYGYQVYLGINFSILSLFFLVIAILIVYQVFWVNNLSTKENIFFIFMIVFCLLEMSWVVSFMSLSYYILGLLLSVCYYIIIGLSRFFLLGKINKKIIKSYLVFGFLSIIVVLLTARWI
jgi:hypothetical protein